MLRRVRAENRVAWRIDGVSVPPMLELRETEMQRIDRNALTYSDAAGGAAKASSSSSSSTNVTISIAGASSGGGGGGANNNPNDKATLAIGVSTH